MRLVTPVEVSPEALAVIECLRGALALAYAGELQGVAIACLKTDGTFTSAYEAPSSVALLGACSALQLELSNVVLYSDSE